MCICIYIYILYSYLRINICLDESSEQTALIIHDSNMQSLTPISPAQLHILVVESLFLLLIFFFQREIDNRTMNIKSYKIKGFLMFSPNFSQFSQFFPLNFRLISAQTPGSPPAC